MCDKPSRFRDSETVPEGTEFCNKMSAKTSEVASPVQFLSDSDETEENLSPALVPQFRKLPGVNSANNELIMEPSDDDDDFLDINVSNPLGNTNKKRRVVLTSPSNSDTETDEDQKLQVHILVMKQCTFVYVKIFKPTYFMPFASACTLLCRIAFGKFVKS